MRLISALGCITVFLAGCLAPASRLSTGDATHVRSIVVVPMEARPLSVPPDFGPGLPLFGLAAVAANWGDAGAGAERDSRNVQARLDGPGTWQPNAELGKELVAQLEERRLSATLWTQAFPLPGLEDRSYSVTMENWLAPIREWFGAPRSSADYRLVAPGDGALVAEVCLLNYELRADSSLLLRVLVRVVSPRDGAVVARADAHNLFEPGLNAFTFGDASAFKRVYAQEARRLLRRSLDDLGLNVR